MLNYSVAELRYNKILIHEKVYIFVGDVCVDILFMWREGYNLF